MNYAAAMVDRGINNRVQGTAVFCLHMEDLGAHLNIGIESRTHRAARTICFTPSSRTLENFVARRIH